MRRYILHIVLLLCLGIVGIHSRLAAQEVQFRELGQVITFPDGTKGVVCYVDPDFPTRGWAMAMKDLPSTYQLYNGDVGTLLPQRDFSYVRRYDLDTSKTNQMRNEAKENTKKLHDSGISDAVNALTLANGCPYEEGWYIPSPMQLWTMVMVSHQFTISGFTKFKIKNGEYYWSSIYYKNNTVYVMQQLNAAMDIPDKSSIGHVKNKSWYVRPVRDFGYDPAEAYWVEKYEKSGIKAHNMNVLPRVTTAYEAVVIYNGDTLQYYDTVIVKPIYDKDTIYELVCKKDIETSPGVAQFTSSINPDVFVNVGINLNDKKIKDEDG